MLRQSELVATCVAQKNAGVLQQLRRLHSQLSALRSSQEADAADDHEQSNRLIVVFNKLPLLTGNPLPEGAVAGTGSGPAASGGMPGIDADDQSVLGERSTSREDSGYPGQDPMSAILALRDEMNIVVVGYLDSR